MTTDHEATARNIMDEACLPQSLVDNGVHAALLSAVASALREAEAPLLKKIVDLSSKVQRVEEINENLRKAVRDQPTKWNDEYYEMKLKEARAGEREACAKVVDEHERASRENGFSDAADIAKIHAAAIRSRSETDE